MESKRIIQVEDKVPLKLLVPLSIQHMFAISLGTAVFGSILVRKFLSVIPILIAVPGGFQGGFKQLPEPRPHLCDFCHRTFRAAVKMGNIQLTGMVLACVVGMILSVAFHILDYFHLTNEPG